MDEYIFEVIDSVWGIIDDKTFFLRPNEKVYAFSALIQKMTDIMIRDAEG